MNKPGGNSKLMMAFNEAISKLGIIELPLFGQDFTWTNKQQHPLLESLDWFFVSHAWSLEFLGTMANTLTRDTSDHVPYAIIVKTVVPRPRIFRFENYLMEHSSFNEIFKRAWMVPQHKIDLAMRLTTKLKTARKYLKDWKRSSQDRKGQ
jgi:hypothetical protein